MNGEAESVWAHNTVYFPTWEDAAERRFWTGEGDLEFEGETWLGTRVGNSALMAISGVQNTAGQIAKRLSASIIIGSGAFEGIAEQVRDAITLLEVEVGWIVSPDGSTWTRLPRTFVGLVSVPKFRGAVFSAEVETYAGDVDRGFPRMWSDADQKKRHPGDRGLEFTRALAEGTEVRWPP